MSQQPKDRVERLRKQYDFRWDVLNVMIGGNSLLDSNMGLSGFPMQSGEDADRFMKSYGYDLEDPIELAEVQGNFRESISFIRKHFLQPENPDGLKLEIPKKILEVNDAKALLLMASLAYPGQTQDTGGLLLRDWACAVLKVVHAVAHIDKDVRTIYFSDIQKQIFDRFYKVIHRDSNEQLYLGESEDDLLRVDLDGFETKPKKTRESMLIKLLHKPESVADDIFDTVGIRFITRNRVSAFRVLKFLKDQMIVMPANIKPSRSKNSLVDIDEFRTEIEVLVEKLKKKELDVEQFETELENRISSPGEKEDSKDGNPHSSQHYRAIQFTSRQLIKLENPLHNRVKAIVRASKDLSDDDPIKKQIAGIDLKYLRREVRFFYPYEVQIVDTKNHEENQAGRGAHSEYKRSQVQTAMNRVMGNLIHAAKS